MMNRVGVDIERWRRSKADSSAVLRNDKQKGKSEIQGFFASLRMTCFLALLFVGSAAGQEVRQRLIREL